MKKILIVGGAGFIGFPLTKRFIHYGYEVGIFDDLSNKARNFSRNSLLVTQGNVANKGDLESYIRRMKPDVIIHLAALHYIPSCIKNPAKTRKVNVIGTRNILDSMKNISGSVRLIFASSAAVYAPSNRKCAESSEIGPLEIYGETKVEGEDLIKKYAASYNIEYTILRLSNVYGFGDGTPHLIPEIIDQIKNKSDIKLGNITTKRDYVYLDDVVDGFVVSVQNSEVSRNQVFNLGGGNAYSAVEVVNDISRSLGRKLRIGIEDGKIRVNDRIKLSIDISKIGRYLNWKPQHSLREGLTLLLKKEGLV